MHAALLADANVLIDYVHVRRHVLAMSSRHVAPLKVLREVLTSEVRALDERGCVRLGIEIVPVTPRVAVMASAPIAGLSFNDRLSLVTAREFGWTCLSNDAALRRACRKARVGVMWGLELLSELHARKKLTRREAVAVAKRLHEQDPACFPRPLIDRFARRLDGRER